MKVRSVEVQNLRGVAAAKVEFSETGITRITGPVGAGKSTLLDAIPWVLYGHTPTGVSQSGLRMEGAEDLVFAEVVYVLNGDTYTARRELKRVTRGGLPSDQAGAHLSVNGAPESGISPSSLTTRTTEILGMTSKQFIGAMFVPQGSLDGFATSTPAAFLAALEQQTNSAGIDGAVKRARSDEAVKKKVAAELQNALGEYDEAVALIDGAKAIADELMPVADAAREASKSAAEALAGAENELRRMREEVSARTRFDAVLSDTKETRAKMGARATPVDVTALRSCLTAAREAATALSRWEARYEPAQEALVAAQAVLGALVNPGEVDRSLLDSLAADKEKASKGREAALAEHKTLVQQVESYENGLTCPTCGQSTNDKVLAETQIARLETEIGAVRQRGTTHRTEMDRLDNELVAVEADVKAHTTLLDTYHEAENAVTTRQSELDALGSRPVPPENVDTDVLEAQIEDGDTANRQVAEWDRLTEIIERPAPQGASPDDVVAAESHLGTLVAAKDTASVVAATASEEAAVAAERVRSAEMLAESLRPAAERAEAAANDHEVAASEVIMLTEFRKRILDDYCAAISQGASDLLAATGGDHIAVTIGDDFAPYVTTKAGKQIPVPHLSGGEKARVALFLRAAMGSVLPGWMMFADEVTANMDPDTAKDVIEAFTQMGRPIVAIGHNEYLGEIATRTVEVAV